MPLSGKPDQVIRKRLDELIEEGTRLADHADEYCVRDYSQYEELIVKSCGLMHFMLNDTELGREYQNQIKKRATLGQILGTPTWYFQTESIHRIVAVLRGVRDNYLAGMFHDLKVRIVADISADYMGQAESLLKEGTTGQYDHVPAVVLCGAVLEDRLRRWCNAQSPPFSTTKSDGSNKTLGPLIEELRKNQKFDKQVLRLLQWWADIRNHAAHGEFDKFTRKHVELMLRGVDSFLANELN